MLHSHNEGTDEGSFEKSAGSVATRDPEHTVGHRRVRVRYPFSIELLAVSLRSAAEVCRQHAQMRPCRRLWIWAPSQVDWEHYARVPQQKKEGMKRKSVMHEDANAEHATFS